MNKHILIKLMALAFAGIFNSAQASTLLTVKLPSDTATYTTTVGSLFDAYIYADALPNFGGFDFNLIYDSNKMEAQSLTSASIFGAGSDTLVYAHDTTIPGTVHFSETISGTSRLNELGVGIDIAAPTLLGTIHFKALASTNNVYSILNITSQPNIPAVFDFDTNSLINPGDTIQQAGVKINSVPAVPLPASAFLFAPGLLAISGIRKKARKLAA